MASRSNTKRSERQIIDCPWQEGRGGGEGGKEGSQLELLETIRNDGVISTMYRCRETDTCKEYLVKRVYLKRLKDTDIEYRLKEVYIWKSLRHRYILTCLDGWQRGADLWLLSEAATSTLEGVVREKALPPPQPLFLNWLYQLTSALQYLHEFSEKTILHRNLKPSNIMVVPHYILKLTDFGFSKVLEEGQQMTQTCVGTALFMSPEMVNKQPYCTKTDLWSLGVTAVYIATLQDAICARSFRTVFTRISQGQVRGITGQYSSDIEDLVHSLLQLDPHQRPSASQFLADLRHCSDHCDTPPTAHSYPGRQVVPQKTPTVAFSKTSPLARQRVGPKSADAGWKSQGCLPVQTPSSSKGRKTPAVSEDVTRSSATGRSPCKKIPKSGRCSAASQTSLLLPRDDQQTGVPSGQFSGRDTIPTVEDLSQTLLRISLATRDRIGQSPDSSQQSPKGSDLQPRQDLFTPAAAMGRESTLSRLAEAIQRHGDQKSTRKTPGDKTPKRASRKMPSDFRREHSVPNEPAWDEEDISLIDLSRESEPMPSGMINVDLSREREPMPSGMINTFPGAFNQDRDISPNWSLSVRHDPSFCERSRSKDQARRSSESSDGDDVSGGGTNVRGTGRGGQPGPSLPQDTASSRALVDTWPVNMRDHWILAEDLVTTLGSDTFAEAVRYVTLFPERGRATVATGERARGGRG